MWVQIIRVCRAGNSLHLSSSTHLSFDVKTESLQCTLTTLILNLLVFVQNYYNVYGGQQQLPSYYAYVGSGSPGVYNYYPFQAQHGHSTSTPLQHNPKRIIQHPYLPQQRRAIGGLQFTTSVSPSSTSTTG